MSFLISSAQGQKAEFKKIKYQEHIALCSRSYPGCRVAFLQQKLPWLPCGIFAAEVTLAAVWHFCSRSYPGCCMAFLQQKLPWLLSGIFAAEVTLAAVWHFCSRSYPGCCLAFLQRRWARPQPAVSRSVWTSWSSPCSTGTRPSPPACAPPRCNCEGDTFSTLWGGTLLHRTSTLSGAPRWDRPLQEHFLRNTKSLVLAYALS